jgi:hypothetical protein
VNLPAEFLGAVCAILQPPFLCGERFSWTRRSQKPAYRPSLSRCATAAIRSPSHSRVAAGSSHHHIAGYMQPRPPEPLPVLKAKGMDLA